jgi:hypothetical protein
MTIPVNNRTLGRLALIGICIFVGAVASLPFVQAGHYNIVRQAMSELALGSGGWLLNTGFCTMGVGTIFIALILRRTTGARVAPCVLALAGVLDFVSAAFHAVRFDQAMTTEASVHMIAGIATFIATIVAMFATVQPFSKTEAWRGMSKPTLAWGCVSTAAFLLLGPGGPLGLTHFGVGQRLMALTFTSWLVTVAALASRGAVSAAPNRAAVLVPEAR